MRQRITLAYSPDTDDAFMVHALRSGAIATGPYDFVCTAADIQFLNEQALHGAYDVTAISIGAYPRLADRYLMMPVGASIGDEFGPALIVRPDSGLTKLEDLAGKRIAVPGRYTSAFMAARGLLPAFVDVPMNFLDIGPSVQRGSVDAGILIHELQLAPEEQGFRKLADLGKLWWQRYQLPLPLGANAIKRDLGPKVIGEVTAILRASIEAGLATRGPTLAAALGQSKAGLDLAAGEQYIAMYVNHRSLAFATDARQAIEQLFRVGAAAGLCKSLRVEEAFYE